MRHNLTLSCKICLLGPGSVGKTSLRRSYLGQNFNKNYNMTIGADFAAKTLEIGTDTITANIWDLSGQMRFQLMRVTYYRGVSGAIFVYDITRRETLDELRNWAQELKENNDNNMVRSLVVANKIDLLRKEDTVPREEGLALVEELSKKYGVKFSFVEASAKTGDNVEKAFELLIHELYNDFKNMT